MDKLERYLAVSPHCSHVFDWVICKSRPSGQVIYMHPADFIKSFEEASTHEN